MNEDTATAFQRGGDELIALLEVLQEIFVRVVVEDDVEVLVLFECAGFVDVEVQDGYDVCDSRLREEVRLLIQSVQTADVQFACARDLVDPAHDNDPMRVAVKVMEALFVSNTLMVDVTWGVSSCHRLSILANTVFLR